MADGDVKAYNFNTGDNPALVGTSRARIKNILVYGTSRHCFDLEEWNRYWNHSS